MIVIRFIHLAKVQNSPVCHCAGCFIKFGIRIMAHAPEGCCRSLPAATTALSFTGVKEVRGVKGVREVKEVRADTLAYVFTEVSAFNSCPEG